MILPGNCELLDIMDTWIFGHHGYSAIMDSMDIQM